MTLAVRTCIVSVAGALLLPCVASAALIAEQPDKSDTRIIHTTNTIHANASPFTASSSFSLGANYIFNGANETCTATSTGMLRFAAKIPAGFNMVATLFRDSGITPHGTPFVFWGDMSHCLSYIPGNGVMTEYEMPVTLPVTGSAVSESNIFNGEAYHLVFGEVTGFPMDTEFKTDPNGNIFYQLFDSSSTPATTTPPALDPVIIIPGILGSAQHNGVWVIDPIAHTYDNLIDTLIANGYERDKTLFTFPYDWHLSNFTSATLLKAKINSIKAVCGCNKVDIVAHSMGGLIARQYIQSNAYESDVNHIIFLGTPQLGAPQSYLMWQGGEVGVGKDDNKLKTFLTIDAKKHGYSDLFTYEHSKPVPSVQELLPVYGYIKHVGSDNMPAFPNSQWYPNNLFLYDLDSNVSNLYNSGVHISNFVGQTAENETTSVIRLTGTTSPNSDAIWGYGKPENFGNKTTDQGLELGSGDGTVPTVSASFVSTGIEFFDAAHSDLPTKTEGRIFKELTGMDAITLVNNTIGTADTIKNILIFQILSPADIVVIAPDGKRVGKDFATNQEVNEIAGAYYSGFTTDEEFITIPNPIDGEYKLLTQGTGNGGSYTLASGLMGESISAVSFFSGITAPMLVTEHDISVNTANLVGPTITTADKTGPEINIKSPATSTYTHSDNIPISVIFTDGSGIATSSIQYDSKPVVSNTSIDLFFENLGAHTLTASATDFVNNSSTSSQTLLIIATASSTQSDVNRVYSLGYLTSKELKNLLLAQLNSVVKWQSVATAVPVAGNPKRTQTVTSVLKVIDTILLKAMLTELQLAKSLKQVNATGYQILANDINWLMTH